MSYAVEKPLTIVVPDLPPIGCQVNEKTPPCLIQQITEKMSVHSGIPISHNVMPLPRVIKSIVDKTDSLIIMPREPSLGSLAEPIAFVFKVEIAFLTDNMDFLLAQPKDQRVPMLRGSISSEIGRLFSDFVTVDVLNHEQMLGMFAKKRLNAVVGPREYMLARLKRKNIDINYIYEPISMPPINAWLYCAKGVCSNEIKRLLTDAAKSITQQEVELILADLGNSIQPD